MSDVYKKFAKKTYDTVSVAIAFRGLQNDGKPVLVISVQSPPDSPFENPRLQLKNLFNDKKAAAQEEPALAGAYAHISAIAAVGDIHGKDKVLVAFRLSPDETQATLKDTKNGKLGDTFNKFFNPNDPAGHAFRYAYENGYTIVGTDMHKEAATEKATKKGDPHSADRDETRFERERTALNTLGTRVNGAVVYITSIDHLPVVMGMKFGENPDYKDTPGHSYTEVYGEPLMINSDDRNSPFSKILTLPESGLLQIDAPGRMDESDKTDIGKRIDEAAKTGIAPQPPSPSPPSRPPSTPTPKKFSA